MKRLWLWVILLALIFTGPAVVLFSGQVDFSTHWRDAERGSAHLAPDPIQNTEAIIQVYAARTYGWRGLFAVHTWISVKPQHAKKYTVYQVIGWRSFWGLPAYYAKQDIPDRKWFNNEPWVIRDIRGNKAAILIPKIKAAAASYPYKNYYLLWPGPNSNTFTAYMARSVPEFKLIMPAMAVGKDYLVGHRIFALVPSGTGYQVSLYGIIGILIARKEGIEINILGLVFGLDFAKLAIILPGIGRIGL